MHPARAGVESGEYLPGTLRGAGELGPAPAASVAVVREERREVPGAVQDAQHLPRVRVVGDHPGRLD